jgi:hypothetical protein
MLGIQKVTLFSSAGASTATPTNPRIQTHASAGIDFVSNFMDALYDIKSERLQGSCGNRRKVFAGHIPYPYIARLFS